MKDINLRDKIFSVSEFISLLNLGLKKSKAKIIGEVSEVNIGPSGHVYFTLKDDKDGAVLNAIIWRFRYQLYGVEIKEGLKIIASGYPEIYAKTGRLSFIAEVIEPAGEGELKKEYERLKKKLKEAGAFEEARKRALPKYVRKIGVITSLKGAVIADFSNNLKQHGFKVKMIDSRVEGQAAVSDLLSGLKTFKKKDIELLIIMRGGGSLESMQAFNNELLVREVINFPVPVLTGIGHHKDEPLTALAADKAVSTPTAVANIINQPWLEAGFILEESRRDIFESYQSFLERADDLVVRVTNLVSQANNLVIEKYRVVERQFLISLQNFKNILRNRKKTIEDNLKTSFSAFKSLILKADQELEQAKNIIKLNNPRRQLELGYSIVTKGKAIVKKIEDVKIGEDLNIRVINGLIKSKVKDVNKLEKK